MQGGLLRSGSTHVVSEIRGMPFVVPHLPPRVWLSGTGDWLCRASDKDNGGRRRQCAALRGFVFLRDDGPRSASRSSTPTQHRSKQRCKQTETSHGPSSPSSPWLTRVSRQRTAVLYGLCPHDYQLGRVLDQSAMFKTDTHTLGHGMGLVHQAVRCPGDRVPFDPSLESSSVLLCYRASICGWQPDCVAGTSRALRHWSPSSLESGTPVRRFWFLGLASLFRCCDRVEEGREEGSSGRHVRRLSRAMMAPSRTVYFPRLVFIYPPTGAALCPRLPLPSKHLIYSFHPPTLPATNPPKTAE